MSIAIHALTSDLHNAKAVSEMTRQFLDSLKVNHIWRGEDFTHYGNDDLSLIYVRTGGTEQKFRSLMPLLQQQGHHPVYLLASDMSNSLPASMEILSYLTQEGFSGEILHGHPQEVADRIILLEKEQNARTTLRKQTYGIIGHPSDWLISSAYSTASVKSMYDMELRNIPVKDLLNIYEHTPELSVCDPSVPKSVAPYMSGADRIYRALKQLITERQLSGFTLRCFDLLAALRNTGCLALARLKAEGIIAGCEGDVPAMLTMALSQALTGLTGFQANPASVDVNSREIIFAHCTIPLNMVARYDYDTHFESGIGVGIRGWMAKGPVTVFKVAGDLSRYFVAEGDLMECLSRPDLCRTQLKVRLTQQEKVSYFLTHPIGNHHIILPGHHQALISQMMKSDHIPLV